MENQNRSEPKIGDYESIDLYSEEKYLEGLPPDANTKREGEWATWGLWKTLLVGYAATWMSLLFSVISLFSNAIFISLNVFFTDLIGNKAWEIISLSIGPLIDLLSLSLVMICVSKYHGSIFTKIGLFIAVISLWSLSIGLIFWFFLNDINHLLS